MKSDGNFSRLCAFAVAVAILACNRPPDKSTSRDSASATPPTFVTHSDPSGFTLQRPAEWQVTSSGMSDIAVVSPMSQSAALIRARVSHGDLPEWLSRTYLTTEPSVRSFETVRAEAVSPNVARALFKLIDATGTQKRASAVAVRSGDVATIFVAIAPDVEFDSQLATLTSILDSFRFSRRGNSASVSSSSPAMRFVRWVDPNEAAWSMDVPAGWRSEGGLIRREGGVRAAYTISAPDGGAFYFGGDLSVPRMFVLPSEIALSLGNREGQPTGPNGPIMLSFQNAGSMGSQMVQRRFGARVTSVRERPDLIQSLRRNPVLAGSIPQMSAAEVEFVLPDGRIGSMSLTTYGQQVGTLGGTWYVDNVVGFVAPRARTSETALALARSIGTSTENPVWARGESAHQAQMGQQWQNYLQWSNNLQRQTLETRWASDDAINRQRRDVLGGTVRLKDPATGETFETAGNNRYYFRVAGTNAVMGVDADFNPAPDLDMRRLLQIGTEIKDH